MSVAGALQPLRWVPDGSAIEVLDQTRLPHEVNDVRLADCEAVAQAIRHMTVRGAPLIGACAAWGLVFALRADCSDGALAAALSLLAAARPTAVNLAWALERMRARLAPLPPSARAEAAMAEAIALCEEDLAQNHAIGRHGLALLQGLRQERAAGAGLDAAAARQAAASSAQRSPIDPRAQRPVQVLTHCNAGWLATLGWGTALAPVYLAHQQGLPVHVWVDETRPRNQGALTAWELGRAGVPHTVIADNAGGHLMQHGQVDVVIVGADRVTARGDVCNKIGTYLKALAAHDCGVPFYAAVPTPTIDWTVNDGLREIPIEERSAAELATVHGRDGHGRTRSVHPFPADSPCANPAFDVTPARLVTGLITELGVVPASAAGVAELAARRGRTAKR